MILQLNPLLEGLNAARRAAANAIHADDEVTVEDRGDHWIFEFVSQGEVLGGGARVTVSKDRFQVLKVLLSQ